MHDSQSENQKNHPLHSLFISGSKERHKKAAVSKLTQAEMILTCIQEVAASNLGNDTNYLNGGFVLVGYLQSLHTNARTTPRHRS
jgi:hypothetical protein